MYQYNDLLKDTEYLQYGGTAITRRNSPHPPGFEDLNDSYFNEFTNSDSYEFIGHANTDNFSIGQIYDATTSGLTTDRIPIESLLNYDRIIVRSYIGVPIINNISQSNKYYGYNIQFLTINFNLRAYGPQGGNQNFNFNNYSFSSGAFNVSQLVYGELAAVTTYPFIVDAFIDVPVFYSQATYVKLESNINIVFVSKNPYNTMVYYSYANELFFQANKSLLPAYNQGYANGYNNGFQAGLSSKDITSYSDYQNPLSTFFSSLGSSVQSLANIELVQVAPNVNLTIGGVVAIPLIFTMILAVFRLLGGKGD